MKVWAKIMRGDKILRDVVYEDELSLSEEDFRTLLQELAYRLDISAPVSLPTHLRHFERFNRAKYIQRDFIEDVDFDCFLVERIVEDKKTKMYMI